MNFSLVCICVLGLVGGCSWLNQKMGLDDENVIEESAEALIEHHTGLDVDLTPESDER